MYKRQPVLLGLGTVNVIYGALSALGQRDLKYVIGYSSVSHMGYVLMGIATLNVIGLSGAVLQMFSHGIMTALFFVVVGVIYERTHTRDIGVLEGLAKNMGWVAVLFVIAGLTSLGLPGLSGFVAELLVFIGLFQTYPVLGILGIIGAGITAVYILRLIAKVFFGELKEDIWKDLLDSRFSKHPDSNYWERISSLVLAITILVVATMRSSFFSYYSIEFWMLCSFSQNNKTKKENKTDIPLLLKVSPDIKDSHINEIVDVAIKNDISAIILTNTTDSNRDNLTSEDGREEGGLSGEPLQQISTNMITVSYTHLTLPTNREV